MGKVLAVSVLIVVIFLAGIGFYFYQLYTVAKNIKIEEAKLVDVSLEGFNPAVLDFYPEKVNFIFGIVVDNPSNYGLVLDKVEYQVCVENRYFGEGFKENVYIPPNTKTSLNFTVESNTTEILEIIFDMIKREDTVIDYKLNGTITLPIKLFGAFKVLSVRIPFTHEGSYNLDILEGLKPFSKIFGSSKT